MILDQHNLVFATTTAQLPTTVRHLLIITTRLPPAPTFLRTTTKTTIASTTTNLFGKRALTTLSTFNRQGFRLLVGNINTKITTTTTNTKYPPWSLGFHSSSAKMVKEVTSKAEWDTLLNDAGDKLVVLDCYADWCGPCRLIAPKVVAFSNDYPDVHFYKVDVDAVSELAAELGVRAMPTFYFFKSGEKVGEVVGANPSALKAAIDKHR